MSAATVNQGRRIVFVQAGRCVRVVMLAMAPVLAGCPTGQPPGFVGTETCLACHDGFSAPDQRETLQGEHGVFSCEECHGPGLAHTRNAGRGGLFIRNPAREPFTAQTQLCAECHQSQVDGFLQMAHGARQTAACIDCHNVHKRDGFVKAHRSKQLFDNGIFEQLCAECHQQQLQEFNLSGHGVMEVATCGSCHDVHEPMGLAQPVADNQVCLQCHGSFVLGFDTEEAIDFHTGPFHPVDPVGTGSSRCTECHMPPLRQDEQATAQHDHTLFTIPPADTNELIVDGVDAVPPNSCAGINGCHDAGVPTSGPAFNVDNVVDNTFLQMMFERIGADPRQRATSSRSNQARVM